MKIRVKPFRPLMYRKGIDHFYSPPFDTIGPDQEKVLKTVKYNITHITLPESPDSANSILTAWKRDGVLNYTDQDVFLVLRQEFEHNGKRVSRTGMIGSVRIFPESDDIIPHEKTFAGPRKNRYDLMARTNCQPEPIFLITQSDRFAALLDNAVQVSEEQVEFEEPEGVFNHVHVVMDPNAINEIVASLGSLKAIVADGHHRLAASRELAHSRAASGKQGWNYIMAYLCPTEKNGLLISGIHRIVKVPLDTAKLLGKLGAHFNITDIESPSRFDSIVMYDGKYHSLVPNEDTAKNLEGVDFGLSADVLNKAILSDAMVLSENQIETAVTYSHDRGECTRMVDSGKASCCFFLPDWKNEDFYSRVSRGGLLPQKSTYFYPKIPSGLALYEP